MGVGNNSALFHFSIQLLYGFFLFGHVTTLKCNKYLFSVNSQDSEVSECTPQGLQYCLTFLIRNGDGEIIHEELGCLPGDVIDLDLNCGGRDDITNDGRSVTCCNDRDYCNTKVVPTPSPSPSPSTTPPSSGISSFRWSGYLTAGVIVAGLTAVFVVVMSTVMAVYFYRWRRHYSRLLAAQGNSATISYTSNGSSRGSESTPPYKV